MTTSLTVRMLRFTVKRVEKLWSGWEHKMMIRWTVSMMSPQLDSALLPPTRAPCDYYSRNTTANEQQQRSRANQRLWVLVAVKLSLTF